MTTPSNSQNIRVFADQSTLARRIYSVTELNKAASKTLGHQFSAVSVNGEIGTISVPRSGHWYFTLKDESANISCVMFKQANFNVATPNIGDQVIITGQLSIYAERGGYQMIAQRLEKSGTGKLLQQIEQLKNSLAAQGLFAAQNKVPLPKYPARVAVITSPTGAAWQDVLSVLQRLAPNIELALYPAQVQGQLAVAELCQQLERADNDNNDLILLTRGGGSVEDLFCFNNETLVRKLASVSTPTVSAIGHDIDTSLTDFTADVTAATPSSAAEVIAKHFYQLSSQLTQLSANAHHLISNRLQQQRVQIQNYANRLQRLSPLVSVMNTQQKIDNLEQRANNAVLASIATQKKALEQLTEQLSSSTPQQRLNNAQQKIAQLQSRLPLIMRARLDQHQSHFQKQCAMLDTLSPLNTLARGYSITKKEDNQLIENAAAIEVGDTITTELKQGRIQSTVTDKWLL